MTTGFMILPNCVYATAVGISTWLIYYNPDSQGKAGPRIAEVKSFLWICQPPLAYPNLEIVAYPKDAEKRLENPWPATPPVENSIMM
jgi:hypothetical protein